ncbi:FAD:protein FMN transferase [bacterium]|nr:FAD:protein FMN transferase [bacterium]
MTRPKIPVKQLLFVIVLVLFVMSYQKPTVVDYKNISGSTMGTTYHLKFDHHETQKVRDGINSLLTTLNQSMSTYIKDSEISKFNRSKSIEVTRISSGLWVMVNEALKGSKLSHGAYDITVGPLLREYGFGPDKRVNSTPSEETLKNLKQFVGYQHIKLFDSNRIQKLHKDVELDLNSIAKGYGVDLICLFLDQNKINNYLVEIGGEIRVKGVSPRGDDWHIGINQPIRGAKSDQFYAVVPIVNQSMATSGNYRSFVQSKDKILGHIIDPIHGKPIQTEVLSATIFAEDCYFADALATMSMVNTLQDSLAILKKLPEVKYYLIAVDKDQQLKHYSNLN